MTLPRGRLKSILSSGCASARSSGFPASNGRACPYSSVTYPALLTEQTVAGRGQIGDFVVALIVGRRDPVDPHFGRVHANLRAADRIARFSGNDAAGNSCGAFRSLRIVALRAAQSSAASAWTRRKLTRIAERTLPTEPAAPSARASTGGSRVLGVQSANCERKRAGHNERTKVAHTRSIRMGRGKCYVDHWMSCKSSVTVCPSFNLKLLARCLRSC